MPGVATVKARKGVNVKLEELLGEELYAQVKAKLDAANEKIEDKKDYVRYVDLSEGNYVSMERYSGAVGEKENLEGQITTLNKTIAGLKKSNADNEELQTTIAALQEDLKKQQKANENIVRTNALKEKLSGEGVLDPDYLIYKAGGLDKFTFDQENKPVGVSDVVKTYKEDSTMAHLFKQEEKPPYHPKNGAGGGTSNPFAKETFDMTKQSEMFRENPEQARALAAAAGVEL